MERGRSKSAKSVWLFLVALLSQNMVIPVMCRSLEGVEDQKNYYGHDPHTPKSSPKTPSHGTPSPSHGSGGGGKACTPSTPSTPSGGGGYYHSPPSTSTPVTVPPPSTSTPVTVPPPSTSTPVTVPPPSTSTPVTVPPPSTSTPVTVPPPVTTTPPTPSTPATPSPPFVPDPNSFPPFFTGTCDYWRTHPNLIWGLCGFWGTVGSIFGVAATPAFNSGLSLTDALANARNDGFGSLFREGTASLLNSMVNKKFPFTTQQVKDKFSTAIMSDKAAASQAKLFKQANEGKLKPRA